MKISVRHQRVLFDFEALGKHTAMVWFIDFCRTCECQRLLHLQNSDPAFPIGKLTAFLRHHCQLTKQALLFSSFKLMKSSIPEKVPTAPSTVVAVIRKAAINNGIVSITTLPEETVPKQGQLQILADWMDFCHVKLMFNLQ